MRWCTVSETRIYIELILLTFLIAAAVSVSLVRRLFSAVIIFACYSVVMSVIWLLLDAPDLAITEAAVGAGISGLLFFVALKRINQLAAGFEEEKGVKGDA